LNQPKNYPVGANPGSVASADFNGDGKADLAVAALNSNLSGKDDVFVLLNNGDGTFAAAQMFKRGTAPTP
jgi:hypothetical protein